MMTVEPISDRLNDRHRFWRQSRGTFQQRLIHTLGLPSKQVENQKMSIDRQKGNHAPMKVNLHFRFQTKVPITIADATISWDGLLPPNQSNIHSIRFFKLVKDQLVSPCKRKHSDITYDERVSSQLVKGFNTNRKGSYFFSSSYGSGTHQLCLVARVTRHLIGGVNLLPTLPTKTYMSLRSNKSFVTPLKKIPISFLLLPTYLVCAAFCFLLIHS